MPMVGIFVERWVAVGEGGGGGQIMIIFDLLLTHGKRRSCVYCHYSNLPAHLYRLISLSFLLFRVSSKK